MHATYGALFGLAFAAPAGQRPLSLPRTLTRRIIMQKARRRSEALLPHGASTVCKHTVSGAISLLSQRCFSPFPHGTSALSVAREYLALERGRPGFARSFTCSALLRIGLGIVAISPTGLSPSVARRSILFGYRYRSVSPSYNPGRAFALPVWALPRSLAATDGISIDFCSSRY